MSNQRVTVETLAAGQRPYGPTWQGMAGYKDKNAPYVLREKIGESYAKQINWASTKLVFFKQIAPGVFKWQTSAEYTD